MAGRGTAGAVRRRLSRRTQPRLGGSAREKERIGRIPPEGTDDIAFLSALIEKLIADGVADARRIYVTGLSNGGAMTMSMLCARANLFAAAAAVIMNLTDGLASSCRPARPVPILVMNGTDDPLVPFNGGKGTTWWAADRVLVDGKDRAVLARQQRLRARRCLQHRTCPIGIRATARR